jgi:hypothetical protein
MSFFVYIDIKQIQKMRKQEPFSIYDAVNEHAFDEYGCLTEEVLHAMNDTLRSEVKSRDDIDGDRELLDAYCELHYLVFDKVFKWR